MQPIDHDKIIRTAWSEYDDSMHIAGIEDVSAKVSTNHVFRVSFAERKPVFAKLSYYGFYDHFREDHIIINNLTNNLENPYENFLARSLVKNNDVFIYRYKENCVDAWVIFYNPIHIRQKMPRRLDEKMIAKMGEQLALFHKACMNVRRTLPLSSKTLPLDIGVLRRLLETGKRKELQDHKDFVLDQCDKFMTNIETLNFKSFSRIPVFVDWNIGNYSVSSNYGFYSRWDYDWFRVSSRMLDFYFFSRVSSDIGDRTVFSYWADTLMEDRFIIFLKAYHHVFPLTRNEVLFLKEAYRFFILNYVLKDGRYFFHDVYAQKLQHEAFEIYLPTLDQKFDGNRLLDALEL
ncbi:MAG: hypothetical protein QM786_03700 [Breznakibacter sp.]